MGDERDRLTGESLARAAAEMFASPEMVAAGKKFRLTLDRVRAGMLSLYRITHSTALEMLEDGESEAMVRSVILNEALAPWPDAPIDTPMSRPIHSAIDDAIAGRPARDDVDPEWELSFADYDASNEDCPIDDEAEELGGP